MRKLPLLALLLAAAPAFAQTPVAITTHDLVATKPVPVRQSDGAAFIAPVLDTTLTARFPAGGSPADNESNTNASLSRIGSFAFVFDGATWDRWTGAVTSTQLPAALAANGGLKVEGVAGGVAVPVSGTFWQGTQPVSWSGQSVSVTSAPTTAVTGTFWPTAANAPSSAQLSDGGAFYAAAKTGQLPSALGAHSALIVEGVASGTAVPVSGTFWQGTQPVSWSSQTVTAAQSTAASLKALVDQGAANATPWNENIAQFGGNPVVTGAGAGGNGIPRVTVSSDSSAHVTTPAEIGVYVEDAGETAGGNLMMAGTVRRDTAASSAGSTGDNATLNTDASGMLWVRTVDPCTALAKTPVPFSIAAATTTQLVAASASSKVYICSLNIVVAGANAVALVEDDSAACASPTAGMAGGTTAATGWTFAANGGMAHGSGDGTVFQTAVANRYVCLITSTTAQASGSITYVLAP